MIDGFTKEELAWVKQLRSERAEGFAELCIELSRKYEITRDEVLEMVNEKYWDSWDTHALVAGTVKYEYPLRSVK